MESEIKLAWKQGYVHALKDFTLLTSVQQWEFAEEAWQRIGKLTIRGDLERNQ